MSTAVRVLVAVVMALLAGCADGGNAALDVRPATSPPSAGDTATSLTIVLDEDGDGTGETFALTCAPPAGDHPDPDAACSALNAAGGAEAFEPVPKDVACTEIYGGPQTARVTGSVAGSPVDARFSRSNGCDIARWDALAPLLGSVGGV